MRHTLIAIIVLACVSGCRSSSVQTVEAFRTARSEGDLDLARTYMAEDARVWYGSRDGAGEPWRLAAGRYKTWDEHFRGVSDYGPWNVEDDCVWAIVEESNDYYRLTERQDTPRYRMTYFIDDDGLLEGCMVSAAYPGLPAFPEVSRFDELEAWALEHEPEEWAYLHPGGELDPTGDRAERTRALANRWRRSVGLAPIE